ncbi:hypothetical protein BBJ29_001388 [Phytophthora kernoviae]|uniref:J domain-containing protein n=1 Tax=Phytophthora kernoviae TaxID=325452 RepID=A0A3F2RZ92_9STRA|nr:hypothetical protein BBJ29_001388 [Phytophthora kernoviae]RLN67146.1 hypothetical protein BBP00_00001782 [Phytophthora kernoviae]
MGTCLYEVLGVSVDCSADDIRRAYHQAARKYHPDKRTTASSGHDDSSAHDVQQFLQVQEAYETLRNADLRQQYDAKLTQDELNRKREEEVIVVSNTIALNDMQREVIGSEDGEDDEVLFTHQCRCGDLYEISEEELLDGHTTTILITKVGK